MMQNQTDGTQGIAEDAGSSQYIHFSLCGTGKSTVLNYVKNGLFVVLFFFLF